MLPAYNEKDRQLFSEKLSFFFEAPENLPIRYKIGENEYFGMPGESRLTVTESGTKTVRLYSAEKDGLLLEAEVTLYRHHAAAEWKLTVTNISGSDIRLSDFTAMDMVFAGENGRILLCNGDFCSNDGYMTSEYIVGDEPIYSAPEGGRPCDMAFPYQRLLFDGYGYNIAIGWPGQWYSRQSKAENGVRFEAGQETFDSFLHPGEMVRTPLMAIVAFAGELSRGINVWRRWYLDNIMPRSRGEIVKPFINALYKTPGTIEFSSADEKNQIDHIRKIKEKGIDINLWWLDAGWYECVTPEGEVDWWAYVGDWTVDKQRFPSGLAPVSAACREANSEFLLWFEPERVSSRTRVVSEHFDWLLMDESGCVLMLNMGIPDCREYITKKVGDAIEEYGVTVYRQDYNVDPLPLWQRADTDGRRGITENLYVQGYLRFWDDLRERFPDLIIDSCASGGRRNDLETMRRAVVMHETDAAYGNHPILQSFFYTLYSWIPYFRGFNSNWEGESGDYTSPCFYGNIGIPLDDYQLYSSMAPMVSLQSVLWFIENMTEEQIKITAEYTKIFHRVAPVLETADFYALTPYHKSREQWTVFQFDKPEEKKGVLQVIRNNAAPENEKKVMPFVSGRGKYTFKNVATGEEFTRTREELEKDGLTFTMPIRFAALWEYTFE